MLLMLPAGKHLGQSALMLVGDKVPTMDDGNWCASAAALRGPPKGNSRQGMAGWILVPEECWSLWGSSGYAVPQ
jgi:hypothetical protein